MAERSCKHDNLLVGLWLNCLTKFSRNDITLSVSLNSSVIYVKYAGSLKPSRVFVSRADEIYGDYREFRAIVSHSGQVRWEPGGVFRTMCAIDITYFPFDDQVGCAT